MSGTSVGGWSGCGWSGWRGSRWPPEVADESVGFALADGVDVAVDSRGGQG